MKWNSSLYDEKHSFVFKYGEEVLALLNPQHGERILDVGCGTGHLTKLIGEAGADVVDIDNSLEMVEPHGQRIPILSLLWLTQPISRLQSLSMPFSRMRRFTG